MPGAYSEIDDFQSLNSHYDQYSPSNLDNPYSQYETEYSPKTINNPYSLDNQVSAQKINIPEVQKEHDYRTGIISENTKGKAVAKAKVKSPGEVYLSSLLNNKSQPKQGIPLFFYLLVFSSLALGATIFIIISIFKK